MIDWFHPAILFILGAVLIPFLKGTVRKLCLVLIPAVSILIVLWMSEGIYWKFAFLGNELIFGKVDKLSIVFAIVFTIMSVISMIYALHVEDAGQHIAAFLYAGSSLGVVFAGDYFTLFVFWEIMAFASVYLVFAQGGKDSVDAGFRYIIMHVAGGVFLLGGIVTHYVSTHSILFGPIEHNGSLSFYLIFIGFILNAAVPPLHTWLSDAYPEATVTGTLFMATFTTKVAVYALARAFPGTEVLVWLGTIMALYAVIYATMQDNFRRLLAYHIVSQVGYMVAAIGIGSEMAINGAVSHAFTNIIFKGLLFMGAGAVIYTTGKRNLSDLGGLYKTMPITMILYMIGGFSISAFPLFAGFVSKSLIISAANHDHRAIVALLLTMASSGTFLSTTLKIPYFMFFGKDSGVQGKEPPLNMVIGMCIAALLCIAIGVFPGQFYSLLPHSVHFEPYTADHITGSLGMLAFTAIGFYLFLKTMHPEPKLSLDIDWFYRKGAKVFMWIANKPIATYEGFVSGLSNTVVLRPLYAVARFALSIDKHVVDGAVNGVASVVMACGSRVRRIQTGFLQHYAVGIIIGIFAIITIYIMMWRG